VLGGNVEAARGVVGGDALSGLIQSFLVRVVDAG